MLSQQAIMEICSVPSSSCIRKLSAFAFPIAGELIMLMLITLSLEIAVSVEPTANLVILEPAVRCAASKSLKSVGSMAQ